jgi:DNA-binding GntR family transcriptional regulator
MRDLIRRELLKRIVNGTYRPGDRLVELKIAREFDTSQAPVREALRELEALRVVESQAYRGTRVRALSEREMAEASEVRGLLEQTAAARAAEVFRGNTGRLRETLAAIEQCARTGDLVGYAHNNLVFHRQIVEAADNEVMLRVWDSLMLEARTLINLTTQPLDPKLAAASHHPIVEALDRGEGELAGRLLREHAEMFSQRRSVPGQALNGSAAGRVTGSDR